MRYSKEIPDKDGIYPVRYAAGEGEFIYAVATRPRSGIVTLLHLDGVRQTLNEWAVEWGPAIEFRETQHICLECVEPWRVDMGGENPCRYWTDDDVDGDSPACERFRQNGAAVGSCVTPDGDDFATREYVDEGTKALEQRMIRERVHKEVCGDTRLEVAQRLEKLEQIVGRLSGHTHPASVSVGAIPDQIRLVSVGPPRAADEGLTPARGAGWFLITPDF